MPQLSEIKKKREKGKFKKKEYRPWDLTGTNASNNNVDDADRQKEQSEKIGNELGNSQITNREQLDNNKVTLRKQIGNSQITNREQLSNELGDELGNKDFLVGTIKKLSGVQKNIFLYVMNVSLTENRLDTDNILTKELAKKIGAPIGTTKTSIIRLIGKGLIIRKQGKTSRGGHICLAINEFIRKAALEAYQNKNPLSLGDELGNNLDNKVQYSSNYNNITTITKKVLPERWAEINFEPIQHIGFSITQVHQLYEKELNTPQVVQASINHFAFGLENNEKIKKYEDPLNVLMGVLRKGNTWTENGYESPKDRALRELEARIKEMETKRKERIKKIREMEFTKWVDSMTNEELIAIAPTAMKEGRDRLSGMSLGALYPVFEEEVWSVKRKELYELLGKDPYIN